MKWEPADLTVGAVVLGAALILAATLVWLSPAVSQRSYPIFAEFDRIDGIAERAPVYLRGYEVGRVSAITPHLDEGGELVFRVQLNVYRRLASGDSLHLPVGTRARLMPPPVIGTASIVLQPPLRGGAPLEPGDVIPGEREPAILDQVQTLTVELAGELTDAMVSARILIDTLTRTVREANRTVSSANRAVETLGDELPALLAAVHSQVDAAGLLLDELRSQTGTLLPAAGASIDSLQIVISDSRKLVADVQRLLAASEPEITTILANLDSTALLLHHFVRQISDRPWRIFTGVEPPAGLAQPAAVAVPEPGETTERH